LARPVVCRRSADKPSIPYVMVRETDHGSGFSTWFITSIRYVIELPFCSKCGAEVPVWAAFCPKCGTQVGESPKPEKKNYTGVGSILVLAGGILCIISSILSVVVMPFVRVVLTTALSRVATNSGFRFLPVGILNWIMGFIFFRAVLGVVLGIVVIYAYIRLRAGDLKTGGTIAIVAGVLLFVSGGGVISGLLALVGGIFCYTSK
jgi:ribosomal protein L40E